jgi:hypothetical protein
MQVELHNRERWNMRIELSNVIFEHLEIFHNAGPTSDSQTHAAKRRERDTLRHFGHAASDHPVAR